MGGLRTRDADCRAKKRMGVYVSYSPRVCCFTFAGVVGCPPEENIKANLCTGVLRPRAYGSRVCVRKGQSSHTARAGRPQPTAQPHALTRKAVNVNKQTRKLAHAFLVSLWLWGDLLMEGSARVDSGSEWAAPQSPGATHPPRRDRGSCAGRSPTPRHHHPPRGCGCHRPPPPQP